LAARRDGTQGQLLPVIDLGLRLQANASKGDKILVLDSERPWLLVDDVRNIEDVEDLNRFPWNFLRK